MEVVGWALLCVPALLLLALCVPVRFGAAYRTGERPRAWLAWLFLKLDLTSVGEKGQKPPKKPKKPKEPKPPKEKPAGKKPLEFSEQLGLIVDLLASLKGAAGMVVRNFKLYKIRLFLVVAGEDAAETAIRYGRVNAAVYGAYAAAKNFLRIGRPEIEIRPDFISGEALVDFEARGRLVPLVAVWAGLRAGLTFLKKTLRRRREAKEQAPPPKEPAGKRDE